MDSSSAVARVPRWYAIPFRVGILTFLGTLVSFAVSLLLGILAIVIHAALHKARPDMRVAYRHIALPVAMVAGGIILVATLVMEIRRYAQSKTLSAIERIS